MIELTKEQWVLLMVLLQIDTIMFIYLATFVYSFIKFDLVRKKVIESFENGDNIAHTQDAFKGVTLSFAIVFGWADLNLFLVWAAFPEISLAFMVGGLTVVFGGLLGVSFREIQNKVI
jgi:hypothetical protein